MEDLSIIFLEIIDHCFVMTAAVVLLHRQFILVLKVGEVSTRARKGIERFSNG